VIDNSAEGEEVHGQCNARLSKRDHVQISCEHLQVPKAITRHSSSLPDRTVVVFSLVEPTLMRTYIVPIMTEAYIQPTATGSAVLYSGRGLDGVVGIEVAMTSY
jgi:hypothetical protein